MYDLTGRIQNTHFEFTRHLHRVIGNTRAPIIPLWAPEALLSLEPAGPGALLIPLWAPEALLSLEPAGPGFQSDFYSENSNDDMSLADVSDVGTVLSQGSVLSQGFESLRQSLHRLDFKTDSELAILREEIGRESAALYEAVDRLHIKFREDEALLVDREQVRSRSSIPPSAMLLSTLPLAQQPGLGTMQEFSIRLQMADEPITGSQARLELRCTGGPGPEDRSSAILDVQLDCDGMGYVIRGHLVHAFTGLEITITSSPFVGVTRLPFDSVLAIELWVSSDVEGAVMVKETILYPNRGIKWK